MNLDVPYYRMGNHERVEYIPLKLALNDDNTFAHTAHEYFEPKMSNDTETPTNTTMPAGMIVLISLLAFVALFLLVYVIYFFVILRDQPHYSYDIDNDPSFLFNKFD